MSVRSAITAAGREAKDLTKQIQKKIRSQKGASLTAALLIFLVCGVVGVVVLTAATTASGRLSSMSQMDQRYYRVTSAVDLLAGELGGKPITITRTKTETETKTTPYTVTVTGAGTSVAAGTTTTAATDPAYTTTVNDADMPSSPSFLTARAIGLMYGSADDYSSADAWLRSFAAGQAQSGSFQLDHNNDDLDVGGRYELKSDGTLVLTVESDGYALALTLKPTITENETVATDVSSSTSSTANGYETAQTTTTTTTKTSTIQWTVSGVDKATVTPTPAPAGNGGG